MRRGGSLKTSPASRVSLNGWDSGIHLPTLFVLDLATKGIFPCMNEYPVLQVIAQDLENVLQMKNPKKENMTGE